MSLLEDAKKLNQPKRNRYNSSSEGIDLCLAWLKNEVSMAQISKVIGSSKNGSYAYCYVTKCLKEAFNDGKLKVS